MNDDVYVNTYYASVGGVSLRELNRLEAILLNTLMWQMGVSQEEYDEKKEALRHSLADTLSASQTSRRGSWKEWIILKEGVCEKEREEVWEKQQPNSASSMQATALSGSTISGDTESISDSDSATMVISEPMDSSSEVSWAVAD